MAKTKGFQTRFQSLSEYIRRQGLEKNCTKEFSELDNNYSRVEYIVQLQQKLSAQSSILSNKTGKNLEQALLLKAEGNKLFQKKLYTQALSVYNKAVLIAPPDTDDSLLAVLFANRSAVLFSQAKYRQCLSDIELALKHGYPKDMTYKLLIRRAKCYQYTSTTEDFEQSLITATDSLTLCNLNQSKQTSLTEEISVLQRKTPRDTCNNVDGSETLADHNDQFPSLNVKVGVAENNEFGRFIHAEEDIQAGSTILVEKPYCSVTLPEYYQTHCAHCQIRADVTLYPCRGCADIVYCSKDCETEAWQRYHQYECDFICHIRDVSVNMGHLAVRTALKAGFQHLKDIADGASVTVRHPYNSQDYLNIFDLEGHESDRVSQDLFWRTYASILLAQMCNTKKWGDNSDKALVILATFTLHHMQVLPCNAHEIPELAYDVKRPYQSQTHEIGGGIYATLSLFNHSCDPSVVRMFHHGNTCVMKALAPIRKDEQVYDNYGALFAVHSVKERQLKLKSQYYFECLCTPCVQDWPAYPDLDYQTDPMYKCMKCQILVVPPEDGQCSSCQETFDKAWVDGKLAEAKKVLDKNLSSLFCDDLSVVPKAELTGKANKLASYSQIVNTMVHRPYKSLNDCEEALKHVYSLLANHTAVNE